jgi:glycosyltransferase involved in cell wall biosynthesis
MTFIVHAPNVHVGGGRTLLLALLQSLDAKHGTRAILDTRLEGDAIPEHIAAYRVPPTLLGRLGAELTLKRLAQTDDVVLCFGNLPPLFRIRARSAVFIQNVYLLGQRSRSGFPFRTQMRIELERLWLRTRAHLASILVVQTPSMQRLVEGVLKQPALVAPFRAARTADIAAVPTGDKRYDFIYVASGEPHKNHHTLIAAWRELARQGLTPSLCLTLAARRFPEACADIESARIRERLNIENVDPEVHAQGFENLYGASRALIYPSLMESFGLPLLEAQAMGLPVLAPELDYVRDILDPQEVFDPCSPRSIARAVMRHLGQREPRSNVLSAESFVAKLHAHLASR